MIKNRDRFDLLVGTNPHDLVPLTTRPIAMATPSIFTTTRGSRFVAHATCPMCGIDSLGIEYHGELMSGEKVYTIAAHTAGMRRGDRMKPRCLGAGMRMKCEGGVWKGASKP